MKKVALISPPELSRSVIENKVPDPLALFQDFNSVLPVMRALIVHLRDDKKREGIFVSVRLGFVFVRGRISAHFRYITKRIFNSHMICTNLFVYGFMA